MTPARTRALLRLTAGGLVALLLTGSTLAVVGAAAQETTAEPPSFAYTLLGRGYAVVSGYPADEVPGGDDGDEEEAEPAEPPPAQTCPEGQRGVPEAVQERLDALAAVEREPVTPTENEVPTPRGQPIKFDFGLADASLRSDPGSHAIAAFFYVDLGGAPDAWTSSEADGYASGHAREEERCGQPFFRQPGDASDVHVISRATDDPAAFAFAQSQQQEL
ncbi:MAG: hypothetical protein KY457_10795, partial [Actinobacteria bacterium]|nr:hypothetical protein [Actinomycetota bacterium]